MFMIFHVNFLLGDLNTYKRVLKDYPLRTKNTSFSLPRSSSTRDYAGIVLFNSPIFHDSIVSQFPEEN